MTSSELCERCGSRLTLKTLHPYPVVIQILFGLSFGAFLLFYETFTARPVILWAWSGFQLALGLLLIRGRIRARKRIYHCIRCERALPLGA